MAKREGTRLMRASFTVFRQDKKMIWLPVVGGLAAGFGGMVVGGLSFAILGGAGAPNALHLIDVFLTLLAMSFIATFFNLGVVFAANDRLEGNAPTVGGCLRQAWQRRSVVSRWAVLSAVVGTAINALEQRLGFAGRLLGALGGAAWAVATFLVLPVLAFEDVGPIHAVERSAQLFKERWGTIARTALRFGLLFWPAIILSVVVLVGGIIVATAAPAVGIPLAILGFLAVVFFAMLANVASLYMRTILYRFAMNRPVPDLGVDLTSLFAKGGATR